MDGSIDIVRRIIPSAGSYFMVPSLIDPTTLFAGGQTGGWWDPSDHATTFQDTGGTTPANTAGQPVARINDKSGNVSNLLQATNSARPILRNAASTWYLEFDGVSQFLNADFTLAQPFTRVSAFQQVNWTELNQLYDGGISSGGNAAALFQDSASPGLSLFTGTGSLDPANVGGATLGTNHVITELWNAASSKLGVDNNALTSTTLGGPGAGAAGGLTVAAQGGGGAARWTNAFWFGAIVIGRTLTAGEIASCRTFFGLKAGIGL